MGDYNPHAPYILGEQWVPIRNESFFLDTETETGHTFRLPVTSTVVSGGFYLDEVPPGDVSYMTGLVQLYRRDEEDRTGPVRKLVIPVNGGVQVQATASLVNGSSVAECLAAPNDLKYIVLGDSSTGLGAFSMFFDVNSYSTQLSGKRILDVALLYVISGRQQPDAGFLYLALDAVLVSNTNNFVIYTEAPEIFANTVNATGYLRVPLGNTNHFTSNDLRDQRRYTWRFQDLQRFVEGASNGLYLEWLTLIALAPFGLYQWTISYCALEVTYCEENRVAQGGWSNSTLGVVSNDVPLRRGQNIVHLRTAATGAVTGTALVPGEYTATVTLADAGSFHNAGVKPVTRALRQLYAVPAHEGVRVTRTLTEDEVPTRETVEVLPQISLHTASSAVTGVHGYGVTFGAAVYDLQSVTQHVMQRSGGAAVSYPQARFYARRFGDTDVDLKLTRVSDATKTVRISPAEVDALPEILDGWREVTLRFASSPTLDNTDTPDQWTWTAAGLVAGNQWQVLVADAPSVSGAGARNVDVTTYGQRAAQLGIGGVGDPSADAVLMLSQDPPAVTGLAVSVQTQAVTGHAQECSADPECVPTGIYYHRITWNAFGLSDTFTRSVSNGLGTATSGQAWTASGGAASDYSVNGSVGQVLMTSVNVSRRAVPSGPSAYNMRGRATFSYSTVATGAEARAALLLRVQDVANDHYRVQLNLGLDVGGGNGDLTLSLIRRSGGVDTTLATYDVPDTYSADTRLVVAGEVSESLLLGKMWRVGSDEPDTWQVQAVDATITGQLPGGLRFILATGNTDSSPTFSVDDVRFSDTGIDHIELQRQDDVDADWATVMRAFDTATTEFRDYETRVGVESRYRARTVNPLDFRGQWSATASSTLTSPGVTGAGDGNAVLIFTANERQDGSANLAYTEVWDRDISEDFSFPEAGDVVLHNLYRRDFVTAFRPTERGGERFTRTLLVHNAATPTGRLRDGFTSLRDTAWEDVSYVCVRSELGDRWLASVLVPEGHTRRNRRLFLARVEVIETTATPSVVELTE